MRYSCHANQLTDIKEACFFLNDQFVMSGSDDGCIYFYAADTGELLHVCFAVEYSELRIVPNHSNFGRKITLLQCRYLQMLTPVW
jgi:hypothetical protein